MTTLANESAERVIKVDAPEYMTIKEAAEQTGVSTWEVVMAVESGCFPESVRYDARLLVSASDVERQRISVQAAQA